MGGTTLEEARTEEIAPERKEEEDLVSHILSQIEIEVVMGEEMETLLDPVETLHHPAPIVELDEGMTVMIAEIETAKVEGLEVEGDEDYQAPAVTRREDLIEVEGTLEIGEGKEVQDQRIGLMHL